MTVCMEYEQQERDLLDRRGLPVPEPDPEPAPEAAGQVRQAAPDVLERPSPGAAQHDAPVGEPVPTPDGGGTDGREPDAADHGAVAGAEPGSEQGAAPDGVGAAHEQPESTGRGLSLIHISRWWRADVPSRLDRSTAVLQRWKARNF